MKVVYYGVVMNPVGYTIPEVMKTIIRESQPGSDERFRKIENAFMDGTTLKAYNQWMSVDGHRDLLVKYDELRRIDQIATKLNDKENYPYLGAIRAVFGKKDKKEPVQVDRGFMAGSRERDAFHIIQEAFFEYDMGIIDFQAVASRINDIPHLEYISLSPYFLEELEPLLEKLDFEQLKQLLISQDPEKVSLSRCRAFWDRLSTSQIGEVLADPGVAKLKGGGHTILWIECGRIISDRLGPDEETKIKTLVDLYQQNDIQPSIIMFLLSSVNHEYNSHGIYNLELIEKYWSNLKELSVDKIGSLLTKGSLLTRSIFEYGNSNLLDVAKHEHYLEKFSLEQKLEFLDANLDKYDDALNQRIKTNWIVADKNASYEDKLAAFIRHILGSDNSPDTCYNFVTALDRYHHIPLRSGEKWPLSSRLGIEGVMKLSIADLKKVIQIDGIDFLEDPIIQENMLSTLEGLSYDDFLIFLGIEGGSGYSIIKNLGRFKKLLPLITEKLAPSEIKSIFLLTNDRSSSGNYYYPITQNVVETYWPLLAKLSLKELKEVIGNQNLSHYDKHDFYALVEKVCATSGGRLGFEYQRVKDWVLELMGNYNYLSFPERPGEYAEKLNSVLKALDDAHNITYDPTDILITKWPLLRRLGQEGFQKIGNTRTLHLFSMLDENGLPPLHDPEIFALIRPMFLQGSDSFIFKLFFEVQDSYGRTIMHKSGFMDTNLELLVGNGVENWIRVFQVKDKQGRAPFHDLDLLEKFWPRLRALGIENMRKILAIENTQKETPLATPLALQRFWPLLKSMGIDDMREILLGREYRFDSYFSDYQMRKKLFALAEDLPFDQLEELLLRPSNRGVALVYNEEVAHDYFELCDKRYEGNYADAVERLKILAQNDLVNFGFLNKRIAEMRRKHHITANREDGKWKNWPLLQEFGIEGLKQLTSDQVRKLLSMQGTDGTQPIMDIKLLDELMPYLSSIDLEGLKGLLSIEHPGTHDVVLFDAKVFEKFLPYFKTLDADWLRTLLCIRGSSGMSIMQSRKVRKQFETLLEDMSLDKIEKLLLTPNEDGQYIVADYKSVFWPLWDSKIGADYDDKLKGIKRLAMAGLMPVAELNTKLEEINREYNVVSDEGTWPILGLLLEDKEAVDVPTLLKIFGKPGGDKVCDLDDAPLFSVVSEMFSEGKPLRGLPDKGIDVRQANMATIPLEGDSYIDLAVLSQIGSGHVNPLDKAIISEGKLYHVHLRSIGVEETLILRSLSGDVLMLTLQDGILRKCLFNNMPTEYIPEDWKGALLESYKAIFGTALKINSYYGSEIKVNTYMNAVRLLPREHLNKLVKEMVLAKTEGRGLPLMNVSLKEAEYAAAVDVGGPSRVFLKNLMEAVIVSSPHLFQKTEHKRYMPIVPAAKIGEFGEPEGEDKMLMEHLGVMIGYFYAYAGKMTPGPFFEDALFKALLATHDAKVKEDFRVLPLSKKIEICNALVGASTEGQGVIKEKLELLRLFGKVKGGEGLSKDELKMLYDTADTFLVGFDDLRDEHNAPVVLTDSRGQPDMDLVRKHQLLLLDAVIGTYLRQAAAVYSMAKGVSAVLDDSVKSKFYLENYKELSIKVQGVMDREALVEAFDVRDVAEEEVIKKIGWLKEWIVDKERGATDLEVSKLVNFITGSGLPHGQRIVVIAQSSNYLPVFLSHTCSLQIEVSPVPATYGREGSDTYYNDFSKAEFIRSIKELALVRPDTFQMG